MKKTGKMPPAPKPGDTTPEGGKVLGPGVVKRPKRETASAPEPEQETKFTPSEQFFRRR